MHVLHDLGSDQLLEVGLVGSSVPVVSDVAAVHDFTVEVLQISVWDLLIGSQVVVQDLTTNPQVTIVEVVLPGPSLRAELGSSQNERVIHAKSEEQGLEVQLLVRLSLLEMRLVEFTERSPDVGLKILWCLVGNLERVLQD